MAKTETLIGFAVKAKKAIFGADRVEGNKTAELIICCRSASERTIRNIALLKTGRLPVIISEKPLEDIVYKKNCKVIGITDKQFAKAILESITENFTMA